MADDHLGTLIGLLYQGQTRLAYYLMTVNASAVVLTLGRLEAADLDWAFLLLPLSVASWVVAFVFGIRHLEKKNGALVANIQALGLEGGSMAEGAPTKYNELLGEHKTFNEAAKQYIKRQTWLMVVGAILYSLWLLIEKVAG
jgi:hypothetical protein